MNYNFNLNKVKMSKKVTQSNKTYQIRPPFKDKFRPAVNINFILRIGSKRKNRENCERET